MSAASDTPDRLAGEISRILNAFNSDAKRGFMAVGTDRVYVETKTQGLVCVHIDENKVKRIA